jgi:hypothetical protein
VKEGERRVKEDEAKNTRKQLLSLFFHYFTPYLPAQIFIRVFMCACVRGVKEERSHYAFSASASSLPRSRHVAQRLRSVRDCTHVATIASNATRADVCNNVRSANMADR